MSLFPLFKKFSFFGNRNDLYVLLYKKHHIVVCHHHFGWGNWIRTNAHEFRAHCLTAWLYPKNSKATLLLVKFASKFNFNLRINFFLKNDFNKFLDIGISI